MRWTFRTRTFLLCFGAAAISVLIVSWLSAILVRRYATARIEETLLAETRLAGAMLSRQTDSASPADLDAEADALGALVGARITFIAPDGRVLGDSAEPLDAIATLENHGGRPEIVAAREGVVGAVRRYSTTINVDMLYAAARTEHPSIAFVRLALPLTEIEDQMGEIRQLALTALGAALLCSFVLAWGSSALLMRRVDAIAKAARRYASGDFGTPSREAGDDELGIVARALDDTAQQLGARLADLSRDRSRTEAILTGMVEGVIVVSAQGRVQLVNDAARRMLRLEGPVEDRSYVETLRHPAIAEQISAALEGRPADGVELALGRDLDRTFVARAAPVTPSGGAVLVLHDVTDLKRADQVRRDFVANVSHELRTPLTAIRGYIEALQDDASDVADRQRFLEIIARNAHRMERLVADLLHLARIEGGQEPVERMQCRIEPIFSDVVADLAAAITVRRQSVVVLTDAEAASLTTDPARLHDVLRNLVENAVNYSPPSSVITLGASRSNGRIVLTVADEGPGVPEADLTRIFERFYRVDKARSRESGGTGLGLSIVKRLVERLGGEVRAENRPTGGALFSVTLPG